MTATGTINNILPQSLVDGPGNRAVVFMQGCSFQCLYCYNAYTMNICNHCAECVSTCPSGALSVVDAKVVWDEKTCEQCDTCISVCPRHSTPKTRSFSPEELWESIKPHAEFISGVTVSGGEATLQMDFLLAFFELIKAESELTTCIETNGCLYPTRLERLFPFLDYAMVDLKACDPFVHHSLTRADNSLVKETIRRLAEAKILYQVRQVVVPGYTDTDTNAEATARFLAEVDPSIPFRLVRFRPHGTVGVAQNWVSPSDETLDRLVAIAQSSGLENVDRSL